MFVNVCLVSVLINGHAYYTTSAYSDSVIFVGSGPDLQAGDSAAGELLDKAQTGNPYSTTIKRDHDAD